MFRSCACMRVKKSASETVVLLEVHLSDWNVTIRAAHTHVNRSVNVLCEPNRWEKTEKLCLTLCLYWISCYGIAMLLSSHACILSLTHTHQHWKFSHCLPTISLHLFLCCAQFSISMQMPRLLSFFSVCWNTLKFTVNLNNLLNVITPFLPGMAQSQTIKFNVPSGFLVGRATKPYK